MNCNAIVVAEGVHPPWNKGESVATKNFLEVLSRIYGYDKICLLATIERTRLNIDHLEQQRKEFIGEWIPGRLRVKFFVSVEEIFRYLNRTAKRSLRDKNIHIHLFIIPPSHFLLKLVTTYKDRIKGYLYQFSYRAFGKPSIKAYSIPLLPAINRNLKILTTSIKYYELYRSVVRDWYYYIPMPLDSLWLNTCKKLYKEKKFEELRILILAHPAYKRFPYDKVFVALRKAIDNGARIRATIVLSRRKEMFLDFEPFFQEVQTFVVNKGLDRCVDVLVENLTFTRKTKLLFEHDVLIYPAIHDVAIDPPLVVLEGMSMGLCTIATNVQSLEHLLNRDKGILINRNNLVNGLYKALIYIYENKERVKVLGFNAFNYVHKFHNPVTVSRYLKKLIFQ